MRSAVIGGGISGLVSAYALAKAGVDVVFYEKDDSLGGHSKTVTFHGLHLDMGFTSFNRVTYPNLVEFFESLGVEMELTDLSFSVSLDQGKGYEWGTRNHLSGLFAQKTNLVDPHFLRMLGELAKFKDDVLSYLEMLENNPDIDRNETLGSFIESRDYSDVFKKAYLIPLCSSIWSSCPEKVMSFSAYSVLSFCSNHHLLQFTGGPQWLTVRGRSHTYVNKVRERLESWGCQIRTNCKVVSVSTDDKGCRVICSDGSEEMFNGCIIAAHAPDALKMLGEQATIDEKRILGAFQYESSDIFLHRDKKFMPQNPAAWSAWNFLGSNDNKVCLTYWLNVLQNLGDTGLPFFVTLNPDYTPEHTLVKWTTSHIIPSVAARNASLEFEHIQGKRGLWFCGAYQGYGFHEDGLKSGMLAAHGLLGKSCAILSNPKQMAPSLLESGARLVVTRFLEHYISTGTLTLLEDGGKVLTFEGMTKKGFPKVVLKVQNPQFYWKIMTQADLGLADAYSNGDFSFVDKDAGLKNLLMVLNANSDKCKHASRPTKKKLHGISPFIVT